MLEQMKCQGHFCHLEEIKLPLDIQQNMQLLRNQRIFFKFKIPRKALRVGTLHEIQSKVFQSKDFQKLNGLILKKAHKQLMAKWSRFQAKEEKCKFRGKSCHKGSVVLVNKIIQNNAS